MQRAPGDVVEGERLLTDSALQSALDLNGFATFPLLGQEELASLQKLHRRLHPAPGRGFEMDFVYVAPDHKQRLSSEIEAVVRPALEPHTGPLRIFNLSFVTKWPDEHSGLPVHQDWAYVDETRHRCWTVWLPLDPVSNSLNNGALGLVPKSHKLPAFRRGANSRPWYLPYQDAIAEHFDYPAVDPGHALTFRCHVLHGSPPNRSATPRRAITFMVARSDVPLRYYHVTDRMWNEYDIDERFFIENGPIDLRLGRPTGARLLSQEPASAPAAPLTELAEHCGLELGEVPSDPDPAWELPGSPLGRAGPGVGVAARAVRGLAHGLRSADVPMLDARSLPELGLVERNSADLVAAWRQFDEAAGRHAAPLAEAAEDWSALDLFAGNRDLAPLANRVRELVDPCDAWVVTAGPQSSLPDSRPGPATDGVVILPLAVDQPRGALAFQAGDQIVALETGVPVAFDPSFGTAGWNFGASRVSLLVMTVKRRLPPIASLVRRLVELRGNAARYCPRDDT